MSYLLVAAACCQRSRRDSRAQRLLVGDRGVVPSPRKEQESAIELTGLSYTVDRSGTDPVAVLTGEIDVASIDALEAAITVTEQDAAGAEVVLDMTGVTFLDSSGLRVLVTAHDRLDTAARRLVIRRPPPAVLRVFEITGLLSTFVVDD